MTTLDQTVKPTRTVKEELDKTITGQMVSVLFQRGKSVSWTCGGEGELKGQRMMEDKQKAGGEGREQSPRGRKQGLEDAFLFGMNSIRNYMDNSQLGCRRHQTLLKDAASVRWRSTLAGCGGTPSFCCILAM